LELRVTRPPLSEILEALLGSVVDSGERRDPISGARIVVSEAEIELPIEALLARDAEGGPVLLASPPFGTMRTGFDGPIHRAHLRLVAEEDE
ncbi:MAG TPA: hypothetical protein VLT33_10130, partial [Labilithrix sp.]|nr:hypothetical protein [Labilithrix sp.]